MKQLKTDRKGAFFRVLHTTRSAQSAMMVLRPGQTTGDPQNEHPRSEQWLYVVAGTGKALVNKHRVALREGSLLLIDKGEVHQVANTGRRQLVTLNFYAPPAYTNDGELKGRVEAKNPAADAGTRRTIRRAARAAKKAAAADALS